MKLCLLSASNFQRVFGSPGGSNQIDAVMVAQTPACDAFLFLTNTVYDGMEEIQSVPTGFDFTYCQAWGLTIDDSTLDQVISDLRAKAYPPMADYLDGVAKGDEAQIQAYKTACLAVKAKYPQR
jgi:hypothetical protein